MEIQWYPGHMTRAMRDMQESLRQIDAVIELTDARAPQAGRNPELYTIAKGKPRILLLNKSDLADPKQNSQWLDLYQKEDTPALLADSTDASLRGKVLSLLQEVCAEKRERDKRRGLRQSTLRAMVVGIPNVGKSTCINTLSGRASTKTGNKPGVTKGQQWIRLASHVDLLDTPGVLWPRFSDPQVGVRLACIGSIRDDILPIEELAYQFLIDLEDRYPDCLAERYDIDVTGEAASDLEQIALARGCLLHGGKTDLEKAAKMLLDDFRQGRLGRITLEEAGA